MWVLSCYWVSSHKIMYYLCSNCQCHVFSLFQHFHICINYYTFVWKWKLLSSVRHFARPHELYSPWNCPGQNTGVGSLSLLQGIFPTQGSNSGLLHCRLDSLPAEPQGMPTFVWSQAFHWFLLQNSSFTKHLVILNLTDFGRAHSILILQPLFLIVVFSHWLPSSTSPENHIFSFPSNLHSQLWYLIKYFSLNLTEALFYSPL